MSKVRLLTIMFLLTSAIGIGPAFANIPAVHAAITPLAPTSVMGCATLDKPGTTYLLANSITDGAPIPAPGASGACIFITADGITLKLESFTLTGSKGGVGIIVAASMVSIIGPGTVTNYADGIGIASGSGNTVKGVDILSNVCCAGDGIYIGSPSTSDGNRIEGNTISSNAGSGIEVASGRGNEIIGNVIKGQTTPNTAAGIFLDNGPGSIIKRNAVTGNSNGLYVGASSSFSTIIANDFSFNTQSGAVVYSGFNTILRNHVSNNTFSGISVAASGNVVRSNTADGNKRSGIALGDVCVGGVSGNDNLIRGNRASSNLVDFFWDGQGTGNIWSHDTATTRSTPIPVVSSTCP